jgi:hypothetical protein
MMNYSYTDIILSDEGSYADEDEDDDIMTLLIMMNPIVH